jgi:predicted transglutaminase-like cysteine proteinase
MKLAEIKQLDEASALKKLVASVLTALALGGCSAVPIDSYDGESTSVPSGKHIPMPDGTLKAARWARYCREYDECKPFSGKSVISIKDADDVNLKLNKDITYDYAEDGSENRFQKWSHGESGKGVCVQYSLAKRAALRKLGYGSDTMSLLTVENGDHMVLLVYTDHGPLIMDSKSDRLIRPARYNDNTIAMEVNGKWFIVEH